MYYFSCGYFLRSVPSSKPPLVSQGICKCQCPEGRAQLDCFDSEGLGLAGQGNLRLMAFITAALFFPVSVQPSLATAVYLGSVQKRAKCFGL